MGESKYPKSTRSVTASTSLLAIYRSADSFDLIFPTSSLLIGSDLFIKISLIPTKESTQKILESNFVPDFSSSALTVGNHMHSRYEPPNTLGNKGLPKKC